MKGMFVAVTVSVEIEVPPAELGIRLPVPCPVQINGEVLAALPPHITRPELYPVPSLLR